MLHKAINIEELKEKLTEIDLSNFNNMKLSNHETILNANEFVDTHISFLERNKGNKTFIGYYNRLVLFYKLIK